MLLKELGIFLLFYIQVTAVSVYLGLALLGVRPGFKKILTMGILIGFTMFIVRYSYSVLEIPLGSHIVFSIASFILTSRYIARISWGFAVAVALIASIATNLSEALLVPVFLKVMNVTVNDILSNLWLHVFAGYFGSLLIFVLAFLVGVTGFSLIRSDKI